MMLLRPLNLTLLIGLMVISSSSESRLHFELSTGTLLAGLMMISSSSIGFSLGTKSSSKHSLMFSCSLIWLGERLIQQRGFLWDKQGHAWSRFTAWAKTFWLCSCSLCRLQSAGWSVLHWDQLASIRRHMRNASLVFACHFMTYGAHINIPLYRKLSHPVRCLHSSSFSLQEGEKF